MLKAIQERNVFSQGSPSVQVRDLPYLRSLVKPVLACEPCGTIVRLVPNLVVTPIVVSWLYTFLFFLSFFLFFFLELIHEFKRIYIA